MPAKSATPPLLRMRGLQIEAGGAAILHRLDLTLARGEILGLIGESGAGKSTAGLAALGYARPGTRIAAGRVELDGEDILALPEAARRRLRGARLAYVAQSAAAAFNPAHRLIDQHAELAVIHGRDPQSARQDAVALYARLGLPDPGRFGERSPHQVSGGQLQRAMLAMAMACRPDVVVFDEPTTALDVTTQLEVLIAIRDVVKAAGNAAIYISHDLAVVAQLADRIMVLRHGRLVEEGPTAALLSRPREDYTRQLIAPRRLQKPAAAGGGAVLAVSGVSVSYGTTRALDNVSLSLPRGTTLAVVGESGSGKSTLARVVTGLRAPDAGTVEFDGRALPPTLRRRSVDTLRRLQMIYQSPDSALNPHQTVAEAIGRPLQVYVGLKGKAQRARAVELMRRIELDEGLLDRLPGQLSGGQKQRVCIARALAAEPDFLVCDEITSALDPLVAGSVLELLLRLQRELGLSLLFITHDIATVGAIADAVVVMHRGRIVERGTRDDVLSRPQEAYTKALLAAVPQMAPTWLDSVLAGRNGGPAPPV
ncbi:ABC transporter ATP-binding protein [Mangrovibrevibacter kandeliae]|uniref:ABC transporter ATP-binding protein n=1 Tax=Mangrovibrevibacter kandeliae TaxID=2968473 RepID=UPI00211928D1|nr:ABC transporter ATP-binding protein [Aurantimonas sp. CSK15Z-1]MCQ8784004.1 ABC transporter ATP-binding protein [Aurantimonas sp. CSK15Z-1]